MQGDQNQVQPDTGDECGESTEVFEVTGAVKWFKIEKGYGFITPDNGLGDVLLHVTCLRASGYQIAYEGARVVCQVLKRPRGMQAFRVLSMDETNAKKGRSERNRVLIPEPTSGWERARVKWFNRVRGFGFLTQGEGKQDLFVHLNTLIKYGFTELRPDDVVEIRWGYGPKGPEAVEIRLDQTTTASP